MTFAELAAQLDELTAEQLAAPVRWWGEDRGGVVGRLTVLDEEHVNPTGDGYEPISSYDLEAEGLTLEELRADGRPLAAGTPLLEVDP